MTEHEPEYDRSIGVYRHRRPTITDGLVFEWTRTPNLGGDSVTASRNAVVVNWRIGGRVNESERLTLSVLVDEACRVAVALAARREPEFPS